MKKYSIDTSRVALTLSAYFVLTMLWTGLAFLSDEFTRYDKGLITGLGYLLVLSISLFLATRSKSIGKFFLLSLGVIVIFLVVSFGLIGLFQNISTDGISIYAVVASILSAVLLTLLLNSLFGVHLKWFMFLGTSLMAFTAYVILNSLLKSHSPYWSFSPRITLFVVYQTSILIPLTLGLTAKRTE